MPLVRAPPQYPFANTSGNVSIPQNATTYVANGVEAGSAITPLPSPIAGTISNFSVAMGSTPAAGQTWTFTLQVGGSATSLVITLANGQFNGTDTTHTAVVFIGNAIDVKVVTSATSGAITNGFGFSFLIT